MLPSSKFGQVVYMLRAKFGLPVQNSDPSFARVIPGLSRGSPTHCQRCARVRSIFCPCTFIVDAVWKMVHRDAFEKWTKETFLSGKKVRSKVLTWSQGEQVRSELCAGQSEDCPDPNFAHNINVHVLSAQFYCDMDVACKRTFWLYEDSFYSLSTLCQVCHFCCSLLQSLRCLFAVHYCFLLYCSCLFAVI